MTLDDNKRVARRFIEDVMVRQDEASVDELVSDGFQPHSWGDMPPGREALKQAVHRVSAGLSDARMEIQDMIAEGDRVAVRLQSSARHTGEFMGLPPSGKPYSISEIHIVRIRDGQVVEHWREADMLKLMATLKDGAAAAA
jgi:predicted ester cyclase